MMELSLTPRLTAYQAIDDRLLRALLVKEQGVLPSQLAERLPLDRAPTSLVGKQLVARQPKPGNRREALLTLTDMGQQVYDAMVPLAVDINRQLRAALSAQEAEHLDTLLDRMQACADDMVAHADLPNADRRRGGNREIGNGCRETLKM